MPKKDIKKDTINQKQRLVIWLLKDGKPGHESQVNGLASALARLKPSEIHSVKLKGRLIYSIISLIFIRFSKRIPWCGLPKPDLIIGAGHKTHLWLLAARLFNGGKIVLLMKPTMPSFLYDLVMIPIHDKVASSANIIETQGVLNEMTSIGERINNRGLILIGGLSVHYDWDSQSIVQQIERLITDNPSIQWEMTTSRRTPVAVVKMLSELSQENFILTPYEATDARWVSNRLKIVSRVWVSEDSVSMVYEALTSGAEVGLFTLDSHLKKSRVVTGMEDLKKRKFVLTDTKLGEDYLKSPESFNESDRCASLVLKRL